ncbi:alpha/beta fold hydrolase [Leucobacter celer]|uniref:alpha/beta fold hydrolase n=1 Tax=Leucobacter celer TaxID=668625 RepID=UPI0006A7B12F|nr:alpha/beta hydrolase [Leucobacter celer]
MAPTDTQTPAVRDWAHWSEPEFIEIDGLRTAYRRKGDGEPVLFLHGQHFTRVWLPFYEELSRSVDLIVPEHPGYGDTPLPETLRSFEDYVLHYEALTRELGVERVHLVGHAIGGWIAANLAVHHPDRIASLTLLTPKGLRVESGNGINPFRLLEHELRAAYFNGREDGFAEYFEQEGGVEDILQREVEGRAHALVAWNPRYDWRLDHRLRRVTAPTLVLGVDDDRYSPHAVAARYAELIDGAALQRIPGADGAPSGHMVHVERPAETAAAVRAHVAAHPLD